MSLQKFRAVAIPAVITMTMAITGCTPAWAQPQYPQPQYGQPQSGQPQYGQPQYGQPQYGQPQYGQAPNPQDDDGDAPDHGVARISLVNGDVSVAHGDSADMVAASPNVPMVAGDRILTGNNARAEVQFDGANLMRVAPGTEVRMGDLEYHHYLVQVAQGMVIFRVLQDTDADVEISTPSVSLRPRRQGIYRVVVRPDGTSELTVRAGEAEVFAPTGSEPLGPGESIVSRGSPNDPEFENTQPPPYDEWDRWSADRDRVFERGAQTSQYVSPDVYGTEDLGNYGRWANDAEYGNVWMPNVDSDWAPYRLGRWSWVDYYGWTWVSYDPWGWAPYHYGRWFRGNAGWAWSPGSVGERHYWRPALVGFFGWGSPGFGTSLSFSFGNVGWVPLAPHEAFRPWYGRGYGGRNVTIVNNTNIVNTYRNGRYPGAVTSMHAGDFGRGAIRNNSGFVRASGGDLAHAGVMHGTPFTPSRESRQFVARDVNTRGMPRTNNNVRFFSAERSAQGDVRGNNGRQASQGGTSQQRESGRDSGGRDSGWRRFDAASSNGNRGNGNAGAVNRQLDRGSNGSDRTGQDSGFRRFDAGTPRAATPRDVTPRDPSPRNEAPSSQGSSNNRGFRGFNTPQATPRGDATGNDGNARQDGFRRFDGNRRNGDAQQAPQGFTGGGRPGFDRAQPEQARPEQTRPPEQVQRLDRSSQDRGRNGNGNFGAAREPQPVRIAPPIVTNRNEYRSEPRGNEPRANDAGFGAARPARSFERSEPQGGGNGGGQRGGGGESRGNGGGDRGGNGGGNRGHGGGHGR